VAAAFTVALATRATAAGDPWLDAVRAFSPGEFAGFGASALPGIVRGAPRGGGPLQGGTNVVSLGEGGSITVAFRDNVVVDGPGDDLVVFENAFHSGSAEGPLFEELGIVSVSADGKEWVTFPYDALTGEGLSGRAPVLSHPVNGIDPLSAEAGGDRFDIGALGLGFVRFVRITDGGDALPDAGDFVPPADKGGFDLDAMGALNSAEPGVVQGMVTANGAPVAGAGVRLESPVDGRVMRRRTRADGAFRFRPVLPSGSYRIVAAGDTLGRAEQTIEVDAGSLVADVELALD
jgi:hypothetical protein